MGELINRAGKKKTHVLEHVGLLDTEMSARDKSSIPDPRRLVNRPHGSGLPRESEAAARPFVIGLTVAMRGIEYGIGVHD